MMPRIIIDHEERITPARALELVTRVVNGGLVSKCSTGHHYCWITRFSSVLFGSIIVATRKRKQGQDSDSFLVRTEKKEGA